MKPGESQQSNGVDAARIERWAAAVRDGSAEVIKTFKTDRRSTVQLRARGDDRFVAKIYHPRTWQKWAGPTIRRARAAREMRGARVLEQLGLRTNRPLGVIDAGDDVVLLFAFVDGPSLHHWLKAARDAAAIARVLDAVGTQAGRLTAAGYVNRDFKPSNLLIDDACQRGDDQPVIIDTIAIHKRRGQAQVANMFNTFKRAADVQRIMSDEQWRMLRSAARREDDTVGG